MHLTVSPFHPWSHPEIISQLPKCIIRTHIAVGQSGSLTYYSLSYEKAMTVLGKATQKALKIRFIIITIMANIVI